MPITAINMDEIIMYYLVSSEYVGANQLNSQGHIIGDSETISITTVQPVTNLSNELLSEGWLGTTNDWSSYGRGEFESIDDAMNELERLGFTSETDSDSLSGVVSTWQKPSAALEKWSAGDWLLNSMGQEDVCREYGITAATTGDELIAIADKIEAEATSENIKLFGSLELITELRDELRE